MDAVIKKLMPPALPIWTSRSTDRPSEAEVEAAVRVLLRWTGDDPDREGLIDTPKRVAKAYREMFNGYDMCPADELGRTFEEVAGYDDLVIVRDIQFHSHCEHHMVPIIGKAHVGYLPDGKVVGLSKIARVVDIFAHRLQTQEAHDGADRRRHPGRAQSARRRRHDRGRAYVHGHARHPQAGLDHPDLDLHRRLQGQSRGAGAVRDDGARRPRRLTVRLLPTPDPTRHSGEHHFSKSGSASEPQEPAMTTITFPKPPADKKALEEGSVFSPRFDADGLVTAVVTDAGDGMLLMVAHMNAEALALTHRDRHRPLLVALARQPLEEGRDLRQFAAGRRDAHRLRPGRRLAAA